MMLLLFIDEIENDEKAFHWTRYNQSATNMERKQRIHAQNFVTNGICTVHEGEFRCK